MERKNNGFSFDYSGLNNDIVDNKIKQCCERRDKIISMQTTIEAITEETAEGDSSTFTIENAHEWAGGSTKKTTQNYLQEFVAIGILNVDVSSKEHEYEFTEQVRCGEHAPNQTPDRQHSRSSKELWSYCKQLPTRGLSMLDEYSETFADGLAEQRRVIRNDKTSIADKKLKKRFTKSAKGFLYSCVVGWILIRRGYISGLWIYVVALVINICVAHAISTQFIRAVQFIVTKFVRPMFDAE